MRKRLRQVSSSHDDGAILLIALAFLLLFGVFIAALLGETSTSFKATQVVQSRIAKTYNADAGIDYAIMKMRRDATICPNPTAGVQSVTADLPSGLLVNGTSAVTVTCQTLS